MTIHLSRQHQVTVFLDTDGKQHATERDAIRSTIKSVRSGLSRLEATINEEIIANTTEQARGAAMDYLLLAPTVVDGVLAVAAYYKDKFPK